MRAVAPALPGHFAMPSGVMPDPIEDRESTSVSSTGSPRLQKGIN